MSDVLPDNCWWGATREPAYCCGATSKSGFPTIQASSCTQHPSNTLKLPGTSVCLPLTTWYKFMMDNAFPIKKTQTTSPWSLTDISVFFFGRGDHHTILPISLVKQLKCLCKIFTKFAAKLHTHSSSRSIIVTLSLIRRTACPRARLSGCSSSTNAHSETGQMAVCCQNLTLGALSSRSALSVLFGALFKTFGLFLNTPRIV